VRLGPVLALGTAAVAAAWAASRRAGAFRVEVSGDSMAPTLLPGDWLVVVPSRRIRRGDVVVLRHPVRSMELVKRVAALPGEEGQGPAEYLVVGDNPIRSTDGRAFGAVSRDAIAGVALFRYWPRPGPVGSRP
jgi:nickel-type superoxide dismutase maturation protease